MPSRTVTLGLLLLTIPALGAGCARPQPTAEQVAGPTAPADLRLGPTPPGGPSEAATGAGAGGSGAAGYEAGRIGSSLEAPTLPPQTPGITYSRMSPVGSSGSGSGDRGNPIPPEVSLAAPADPKPAGKTYPGTSADPPETGRQSSNFPVL